MAKRRRWLVWLVLVCTCVNVLSLPLSSSEAATPADELLQAIDDHMQNGLDYLLQTQSESGYWGGDQASRIRNTSEIAELFQQAAPHEAAYQNAVDRSAAWLTSQPLTQNLDFTSRIYPFIQDSEQKQMARDLFIASQNYDGGWGIAPGYASDVLDTSIVAQALLTDATADSTLYQQAAAYLLDQQNQDGSWSYAKGREGNVFFTAQAILALDRLATGAGLQSSALLTGLQRAGQYLISQQQEDQLWGTDSGRLSASLLAYRGLLQISGEGPVDGVPERILALQQEDGSWDGNPYTTVTALQALQSYKLLAAAQHRISDIHLYKVTDGSLTETNQYEAYDWMEIQAEYEQGTDQTVEQAFIQTPNGSVIPAIREDALQWQTADYAPGEYLVVFQLKKPDTGQVIASKAESFTILPTFKVEGVTVSTSPGYTSVDEPVDVKVQASVFVKNNLPGQVTVTASVYDADSSLVDTGTMPYSFLVNEPLQKQTVLSFSPNAGEAGDYRIAAQVELDGNVAANAEAIFKVLPPPAPTRIDIQQSLDKSNLYPGDDTVQVAFTLDGLGSPSIPERKPLDMVFVLDVSGSMSGSAIAAAKTSANKLMELLQDGDRGAVVLFHSSASVAQNLTEDISLLTAAINSAYASGGTAIHSGISSARQLLSNAESPDRQQIIVLLSDGQSSRASAISQAQAAADSGIVIHTIGLGSGVDTYLMETIADVASGIYRLSPTADELEEMMNDIGGEIFNTAGRDVRLTTTVPAGLQVDTAHTLPVPNEVVLESDGSTTVTWEWPLIVMGQQELVALALTGAGLVPGSKVDVTESTVLTYTNKLGQLETVPLQDLSLDVVGSMQAEVQTDKPVYAPHEQVDLTVQVENMVDQIRDATVKVEILDENSSLVDHVGTYDISGLAALGTDVHTLSWNTENRYAGAYQVRVTVEELGQTVVTASTVFDIEADQSGPGGVTLDVVTDKRQYEPGETVIMTTDIFNASTNSARENLTVTAAVYGESGNVLFAGSQPIVYMTPQHRVERLFSWDSSGAKPGHYEVRTTVTDAVYGLEESDSVWAADTAGFEILSTGNTGVGLVGELQVKEAKVQAGGQAIIDYTLQNIGNRDIQGARYQLMLVNPQQGNDGALETFERPLNLNMGTALSEMHHFDTAGLDTGAYLVVLRAVLADGTIIPLSSGAFTLEISVQLQAEVTGAERILVWSEKREERRKLEAWLEQRGVYYEMVANKFDFLRELRSNQYNMYVLAHNGFFWSNLVNDELLAQLHSGASVITTASSHPAKHNHAEMIGGIPAGHVWLNDASLESGLWTEPQISYSGWLNRLKVTTGIVWASLAEADEDASDGKQERHSFSWGHKDRDRGPQSAPAVIHQSYGSGQAVYIGFDLNELDGVSLAALLNQIADRIQPAANDTAGSSRMIGIQVTANGGPLDTEVRIPGVPEILVTDPLDFTREGDDLVWRGIMQPGTSVRLQVLGAPVDSAEIAIAYGTWHDGTLTSYPPVVISLPVAADEDELLHQAIDELQSVGPGMTRIWAALLRLQLEHYRSYPPASTRELEKAIERLNLALAYTRQRSWLEEVRYTLEELQRLYQTLWYAGGRE